MEQKLEKALKWIVNILNKHQVSFQIVGGLAAHIYGADRPINDIDLDMPEDNFKTILVDIEKYIISGLETVQYKNLLGLKIPVIDPQELIEYKKLLQGEGYEHQDIDIEAVEKYLAS